LIDELNLEKNIYYIDTDSIVLDKKLNNYLISEKELGKFKLEHKIKEGFFISQKSYYILDDQNNEFIKFKGLKEEEIKSITKGDFFSMLKGPINLKIEKSKRFIRKLMDLSIKNKESILNLNINYNKRKKIYKKFFWFNTTPIIKK